MAEVLAPDTAPPHRGPRVRMMINNKVLEDSDPTPPPDILIQPPSRRGSAAPSQIHARAAAAPPPLGTRRGSSGLTLITSGERRGSRMLSSSSRESLNKRRDSGGSPLSPGQRRGSQFMGSQRKIEAQSHWEKVANKLVGTGGGGGARRGSVNPAAALLMAARRSTASSTFDSFMNRVSRRRSSGKVNLRRGSLFSAGSDKKEPEKPIVDKIKCRRKFQMWMRIVTALVKIQRRCDVVMWGSTSAYRDQMETVKRFTSRASEEIEHYSDFNPNEYKANKQMRMSAKAKEILVKPPEQRTHDEILYATIALRGISLIAEYPVRMQKNLAKYGRFECHEPKRAIVKQHHPPFAFYFILFGTVIVAVRPDDVQDAKTVVKLRRGESFGELSIMNGTRRQSTVITQEYSEFLSIDVQTYENMFMVGGSKNINDPDHNEFMESLFFLKGWPKQLLHNNTEFLKFVFFQRCAVITKDSNYHNWIIILKSGSVQVLKKLVKTIASVDKKTGKPCYIPNGNDLHLAFLTNPTEYYRLLAKTNALTLPNITTPSSHRPYGGSYSPDLISDQSPNNLTSSWANRSQSAMTARLTGPKRKVSTNTPKMMRHSMSARGSGPTTSPSTREAPDEAEENVETPDDMVQRGRRTYLDDLDSGYKQHIRTEADENPEFVHVQTLTKGDVFGLNPLVFNEQPSLCLVSNGCECILINKKFYYENCPTDLRIRLKNQLSPYPNDEILQKDLMIRVNWDVYKKVEMGNVLQRQSTHKTPITGWA